MIFILQLIIFLLIVFIYLHIRFQLKTNNNLEVYEIDYDTNENLQKTCDIRVPVLFDAPSSSPPPPEFTKEQNRAEINVKDATEPPAAPPVKFSYSAAIDLIHEDKMQKYYSDNNADFIENEGLTDEYRKFDDIFAPQMTAQRDYDIIIGSRHVSTPLRFHTNYRKFLYVSSGQATIKLATWKNEKYLNTVYNWADFDFYSLMDETAQKECDKCTFIEVIVPCGKVISIPPYWWYSIKMTHSENENKTIIYSFSYKTYMNLVAILPKLLLHFIYNNNFIAVKN